jgi:hypothetical protein
VGEIRLPALEIDRNDLDVGLLLGRCVTDVGARGEEERDGEERKQLRAPVIAAEADRRE